MTVSLIHKKFWRYRQMTRQSVTFGGDQTEKRVSLPLVSRQFFLITMGCIVTAGFAMILLRESASGEARGPDTL